MKRITAQLIVLLAVMSLLASTSWSDPRRSDYSAPGDGQYNGGDDDEPHKNLTSTAPALQIGHRTSSSVPAPHSRTVEAHSLSTHWMSWIARLKALRTQLVRGFQR